MRKKIQVIIEKTNKKLGKKGSIIKVSQGYALNYLIPNNLAQFATKGKIKHINMLQKLEEEKLQEQYNKAYEVQKNLAEVAKISIKKKYGEQQQIFGSINEKEIIEEIFNYTGEKLEKKQISLPEIKKLGIFNIEIQIFNDIITNLKLQVLPEDININ
uniref:50S ribosomal protein L9, chloroplastic n=1 Tax=Riquetophycus sp. TaxID=1897556 RepID=A0A1C9C8C6_9FLOR|nr:ribosomal protein L9 [Riquetophycus sp.]